MRKSLQSDVMKGLSAITTLMIVSAFGSATQTAYYQGGDEPGVADYTSLSGLSKHHHPISTPNAEAQRYFDRGLLLVFAFNSEEAVKSFRRAAELDPQAAMPYWGIALALGPNINSPIDPSRERAAVNAIQKAVGLGRKASIEEVAYVEALAQRYSIEPASDFTRLDIGYSEAMSELVKRFPDDLDAATLYAESLMDLHPWKLWSPDGKPSEGTEKILGILESVLRRDPDHIGANHYYIHALEASPNPERALPSAERLAALAPAVGHLVHMPSHIYIRTGDYLRAAESNVAAIQADDAYFRTVSRSGMYGMMYYAHNLHFLVFAYSEAGRLRDAKDAANRLFSESKSIPMLDTFGLAPLFVLLRFNRWTEILQSSNSGPSTPLRDCLWHFARGSAHAVTGEVSEAENERIAFARTAKDVPNETTIGDTGLNRADEILGIAAAVLDARIDLAKGRHESAINSWRKAVALQDSLAYDEPPVWYYPVRESLGAALLGEGRAAEAELVFRDDLQRNPRNGRSLFGLRLALLAQQEIAGAEWIRSQFDAAWGSADTQLTLANF
jgi:tetratricopeptide (TPR) repeat protein